MYLPSTNLPLSFLASFINPNTSTPLGRMQQLVYNPESVCAVCYALGLHSMLYRMS